jgi:RNA polymerase sigma-70 factor (ECF subfamily)
VNIIVAESSKIKDKAKEQFLNYEELSDAELVEMSCNGDEYAFAEIVRRYSPRVFLFVGKFFRQHSVIEEIAQDIFLRIYVQLRTFANRGSFEGWLTRITVNTCINQLRSTKRETELTFSALTDEEADWLERKLNNFATNHSSDEDRIVASNLVNRVLEAMSADDRAVLTLIDAEGYSVREVAEMMGWKESKVKTQAFRARRRMRQAIEKLMKKEGKQK